MSTQVLDNKTQSDLLGLTLVKEKYRVNGPRDFFGWTPGSAIFKKNAIIKK
jgi:hypothetical protein